MTKAILTCAAILSLMAALGFYHAAGSVSRDPIGRINTAQVR